MLPGSVNYRYISRQGGKPIIIHYLAKVGSTKQKLGWIFHKKLLTVNYLALYWGNEIEIGWQDAQNLLNMN